MSIRFEELQRARAAIFREQEAGEPLEVGEKIRARVRRGEVGKR